MHSLHRTSSTHVHKKYIHFLRVKRRVLLLHVYAVVRTCICTSNARMVLHTKKVKRLREGSGIKRNFPNYKRERVQKDL